MNSSVMNIIYMEDPISIGLHSHTTALQPKITFQVFKEPTIIENFRLYSLHRINQAR